MSAKRILYLSPNAHFGGAEHAVEILLKLHDRSKYAPEVAFLRQGPLVEKWRSLAPVHILPVVRLREFHKHPKLIGELVRIIKNSKIDLVHSTMAYGQFFGGVAANIAKVSNVWFQHGPVNPRFDRLVGLIPTNSILINSKFTLEEQKKLQLLKWPFDLVYGTLDTPPNDPITTSKLRKAFRNQISCTDNEVLVGIVGRIQEWKGQLFFLKAFREASKQNPNLKAIVVGSSDIGSKSYEAELKEFVQSTGLSERVHFTGFLPDIEPALQALDVLVHCSIQAEPFGSVPLEGMARGKATIACPWGGTRETIQNGQDGLLVDPTDTSALADAINRLAQSSELRADLGAQGKVSAARFLDNSFVKKIEAVYDRILS